MMKPTTLIIAALATVGALAQDPTRTEGAGLVSEPVFTTVASVSPSFYTIPRGSVLSAGTWDLFYSDNVPLVLQSDRGGGMSAQVMVEGRLPIDPTALSLTVETHATMPGVQQVVALEDIGRRAVADSLIRAAGIFFAVAAQEVDLLGGGVQHLYRPHVLR